jgi:hypothetical protein
MVTNFLERVSSRTSLKMVQTGEKKPDSTALILEKGPTIFETIAQVRIAQETPPIAVDGENLGPEQVQVLLRELLLNIYADLQEGSLKARPRIFWNETPSLRKVHSIAEALDSVAPGQANFVRSTLCYVRAYFLAEQQPS